MILAMLPGIRNKSIVFLTLFYTPKNTTHRYVWDNNLVLKNQNLFEFLLHYKGTYFHLLRFLIKIKTDAYFHLKGI